MNAENCSAIRFEHSERVRVTQRALWTGFFGLALSAALALYAVGDYGSMWFAVLVLLCIFWVRQILRQPPAVINETTLYLPNTWTGRPMAIPFSAVISLKEIEGVSLVLTYVASGSTRQATIHLPNIKDSYTLADLLRRRIPLQPERQKSARVRARLWLQEYFPVEEMLSFKTHLRMLIAAWLLGMTLFLLSIYFDWNLSPGAVSAVVIIMGVGLVVAVAILRRRKRLRRKQSPEGSTRQMGGTQR